MGPDLPFASGARKVWNFEARLPVSTESSIEKVASFKRVRVVVSKTNLATCNRWIMKMFRINSSEAKASRVIICKFPVKLPFPVHSVLQIASKSRHVHSNRVPGRHFIICACVNTYSLYTSYSVLGLRSVMTTALDIDERLHSEVGLKQERERTSHVRVSYARRQRLQRRTQRKP